MSPVTAATQAQSVPRVRLEAVPAHTPSTPSTPTAPLTSAQRATAFVHAVTTDFLGRAPSAAEVVAALEQFAARFGAYPWPTFSLAVTGGLGGGSTRGAYTQFLHWWALCNYNAEQYYGINTYKPVTGMNGLAHCIEGLYSKVRTPVTTARLPSTRTRPSAIQRLT